MVSSQSTMTPLEKRDREHWAGLVNRALYSALTAPLGAPKQSDFCFSLGTVEEDPGERLTISLRLPVLDWHAYPGAAFEDVVHRLVSRLEEDNRWRRRMIRLRVDGDGGSSLRFSLSTLA